jgi:hypothetical protein
MSALFQNWRIGRTSAPIRARACWCVTFSPTLLFEVLYLVERSPTAATPLLTSYVVFAILIRHPAVPWLQISRVTPGVSHHTLSIPEHSRDTRACSPCTPVPLTLRMAFRLSPTSYARFVNVVNRHACGLTKPGEAGKKRTMHSPIRPK